MKKSRNEGEQNLQKISIFVIGSHNFFFCQMLIWESEHRKFVLDVRETIFYSRMQPAPLYLLMEQAPLHSGDVIRTFYA